MFDMFEFIEKQAMQKYAGDKAAVAAFMEGFSKEADGFAGFASMGDFAKGKAIEGASKAGFGLLAGLAGAGIVAGINSYSKSSDNYKLRTKFEAALTQVMSTNRVVKGTATEKVRAYAETIFKFAPHVAADPNLLSSILANAVLGEGIDQMTIKNLVDLEGRHVDNNSYGPLPTFKAG